MTRTLLKWERYWEPARSAGMAEYPGLRTGFAGVALEFKWRDLWVGAYLDPGMTSHVWVCLVPTLPIHVWWRPPLKKEKE